MLIRGTSGSREQQLYTIRATINHNIYQDRGDNYGFVFHPRRVVCKDVRFGDGHFVDFVPVSDLWEETASSMTATCEGSMLKLSSTWLDCAHLYWPVALQLHYVHRVVDSFAVLIKLDVSRQTLNSNLQHTQSNFTFKSTKTWNSSYMMNLSHEMKIYSV